MKRSHNRRSRSRSRSRRPQKSGALPLLDQYERLSLDEKLKRVPYIVKLYKGTDVDLSKLYSFIIEHILRFDAKDEALLDAIKIQIDRPLLEKDRLSELVKDLDIKIRNLEEHIDIIIKLREVRSKMDRVNTIRDNTEYYALDVERRKLQTKLNNRTDDIHSIERLKNDAEQDRRGLIRRLEELTILIPQQKKDILNKNLQDMVRIYCNPGYKHILKIEEKNFLLDDLVKHIIIDNRDISSPNYSTLKNYIDGNIHTKAQNKTLYPTDSPKDALYYDDLRRFTVAEDELVNIWRDIDDKSDYERQYIKDHDERMRDPKKMQEFFKDRLELRR